MPHLFRAHSRAQRRADAEAEAEADSERNKAFAESVKEASHLTDAPLPLAPAFSSTSASAAGWGAAVRY
jgi:hypothetical protein